MKMRGNECVLIQLDIKNLAIIENSKVDFQNNLNVLSGETGAGKSIILAAIDIITGGRVSKNEISTGAEKLEIRAVFLKNDQINQKLDQLNLNTEDDYLVLERSINTKGRGIIRINDCIQTNQKLKEIAKDLVDICGQRDAQKLFKEETYINILDERIEDMLIQEYKETYKKYKKVKKELEDLKNDDRTQEQYSDLYNFQIKEIEEANLDVGEEEELEKQKVFLENFEKIDTATNKAIQIIDASEILYDALKEIESIQEAVPEMQAAIELLNNSYQDMKSAKSEIDAYLDNISYDSYEMDQTMNRLEEIKKVKKKYGDTVEEILDYYEEIKEKITKMENRDADIEMLEFELEKIEKEIELKANQLTEKRKEKAIEISIKLEKELKDLCIENAQVSFEIEETKEYNKNGKNKVELMFSANKGQEKQPLSKAASGGEMSRVLLGLKLMSEHSENQTMIFDEVDVGVGGEAGRVIGEKLKKLGEKTQVICISHLPQVAAKGMHHFLIEKNVESNRTISKIRKLDYLERKEEIARMIFGEEKTEITMKQAEEMLK